MLVRMYEQVRVVFHAKRRAVAAAGGDVLRRRVVAAGELARARLHVRRDHRLVLEVTESLVLEPSARPIVDRLRKRGLRVALDDFGTGYSSLGSLHQFPVDIVKIDRSLVERCIHTSGSAVLAAVVELGEALGVDIVADGVEAPLQETELRRLGCKLAQGYLYSRPVCAADAHEIILLQRQDYRNAA
jgi:EAL domain-containing protein (putative c-di-GMP-specific phosphodiesterase class I)